MGNDGEARRLAEQAVADASEARYRPRGVCATTLLGSILRRQGDDSAAEEMLRRSARADQLRLDQGDEGYEAHYDLAAVHAIRGDRATALACLGRAIDAGWRAYPLARRDPLLGNLQGDDGFHRILTEVAAEVAEMRRRLTRVSEPPAGDLR